MAIKVEVWGDYACFSRPEMKTERVSYDMMTPSAARGLLEAVYWHPGLKWIIDKIYLMKPILLTRRQPEECGIRMTSIKRNEIKSKVSANNVRSVMTGGRRAAGRLCLGGRAGRGIHGVRAGEVRYELD